MTSLKHLSVTVMYHQHTTKTILQLDQSFQIGTLESVSGLVCNADPSACNSIGQLGTLHLDQSFPIRTSAYKFWAFCGTLHHRLLCLLFPGLR